MSCNNIETLSSHISTPEFSVQASSSTPPLLQTAENNKLSMTVDKIESSNIYNKDKNTIVLTNESIHGTIIYNYFDEDNITLSTPEKDGFYFTFIHLGSKKKVKIALKN